MPSHIIEHGFLDAEPMKKLVKSALEQCASRFGPHRRNHSTQPRLWVLMYHRILPASDPRYAREEPGMIVTPDTFRQQLRILKELFEVMPLAEWCGRRDAGRTLPARACAITFDDGWLDNYQFALPILQQEQLPATLFAVADMIGTQRQFWPNRLARVLGATQGRHFSWMERFGLGKQTALGREAVAQLIHQCKQMRDEELLTLLDSAEKELGLAPEHQPALVSWDQLREMQGSGFFDIGSHTSNHYRLLEGLADSTLTEEIIASKRKLERELERPVSTFCYPNGDTSPAAVTLVQEHYRAAVTTRRGINSTATASHSLQRIGVHEDVSDTRRRFEARLSGWI
jgi:peptidoglycan/xylan/chitin deacetylase (PgdA/CDA1 family)